MFSEIDGWVEPKIGKSLQLPQKQNDNDKLLTDCLRSGRILTKFPLIATSWYFPNAIPEKWDLIWNCCRLRCLTKYIKVYSCPASPLHKVAPWHRIVLRAQPAPVCPMPDPAHFPLTAKMKKESQKIPFNPTKNVNPVNILCGEAGSGASPQGVGDDGQMPRFAPVEDLFRCRHFDQEIVVLCVRWHLSFKLGYRDPVAMMSERGIDMAHTTILRWVQHYTTSNDCARCSD